MALLYYSKPAPVSMADEWFEISAPDHFWMQWRFYEIQKMLQKNQVDPSPVFEVGCGNGVVLTQMERVGIKADGCDLNEYALLKAADGPSKKMIYNIYEEHPDLLHAYKSVFLLDVIEHIGNDSDFVKQALKHVQKDGYVLINVPAGQYLFSDYDTAAGHERRYSAKKLKSCIENAGVQVIDTRYWGWSMLPVALLRKLMLKFVNKDHVIEYGFKPASPAVDRILRFLFYIERKIRFGKTGTSLLALGKKI